MKHNVTKWGEQNETMNSVFGNHLIELEPGDYKVEEASSTSDTQPQSPSIFTG